MKKEFLTSVLRKLLMLLLSVTAAGLVLRTEYVSSLLPRGLAANSAAGSATASPFSSMEAAEALRPRAVMVLQPGGARTASVYQGSVTTGWFLRFSALLGEAVGSAGDPETVSEEWFQTAVHAGSACFLLEFPCPLRLLSGWLGAGGGAEQYASDFLCLCLEDTEVSLLFRTEGRYYRCSTAVVPDTLSARMAEYQGAGFSFAWELPLLRGTDPFLPVVETLPTVFVPVERNGADDMDAATLAEAAGMNSRLISSYYDADGTLVINENTESLRLERSGTMIYRAEETAGQSAQERLSDAVGSVCGMLRRCAASCGGEGELVFAGIAPGEEAEEYLVRMEYCVSGIPVRFADGPAGTALIRNGQVLRAELRLRRLSLTSKQETVLPVLQAAAIAAQRDSGTPKLVYDAGRDGIRCVWVYD